MVTFKKKCGRCRKNYVLATNRTGFIVCYECNEKQMKGEIKDPEMKKMFAIPLEFYKKSSFLCDIKVKYLQYGSLSERQVAAFKKTVESFKEAAKEAAGLEKATSSEESKK